MSSSVLHHSTADLVDEELHVLLASSPAPALATSTAEAESNAEAADLDRGADATPIENAHSDMASAGPIEAPTDATAPACSASPKARSLAAGQVNRIVDGALPAGMSISRDARIALQKCATISLLYLACLADAERKAGGSSRTTLNVQDIRSAMEAAGVTHLLPLMSTAAKRTRE